MFLNQKDIRPGVANPQGGNELLKSLKSIEPEQGILLRKGNNNPALVESGSKGLAEYKPLHMQTSLFFNTQARDIGKLVPAPWRNSILPSEIK